MLTKRTCRRPSQGEDRTFQAQVPSLVLQDRSQASRRDPSCPSRASSSFGEGLGLASDLELGSSVAAVTAFAVGVGVVDGEVVVAVGVASSGAVVAGYADYGSFEDCSRKVG